MSLWPDLDNNSSGGSGNPMGVGSNLKRQQTNSPPPPPNSATVSLVRAAPYKVPQRSYIQRHYKEELPSTGPTTMTPSVAAQQWHAQVNLISMSGRFLFQTDLFLGHLIRTEIRTLAWVEEVTFFHRFCGFIRWLFTTEFRKPWV